MTPHMRELSQKFEGVETVDPPSLSRRVRREFPDLTSPLTKSASRQLLSEIRRKLDLRVPRRPRAFARLVRKRTTSKVSYHAPLYGYAFSRIKSTPHHHSHALRRHGQGQVTRASKPATLINNHRTPKPPSFLTRLRNHIPFDARLVSRWLGLFRQAGQRSRCCVEPRGPVIDHVRFLDPADRRDPQRRSELGTTLV